MTTSRSVAALAVALLLTLGCRNEPPPGLGSAEPTLRPAPALSGDQARDAAELARLDAAAAAMARTDGCAEASSCATIAVGARACGGPRHYLTYCRLTTDETLLRRQVDEVARFESAMNVRYDAVSTCEFRMPPEVGVAGGRCQAAPR